METAVDEKMYNLGYKFKCRDSLSTAKKIR